MEHEPNARTNVAAIRILQNFIFGYNYSFLLIELILRVSQILAYSPLIIPCFDVVRVYLHRMRNGKNPFLPDKNHIHHKLLAVGMRQRAAMITIVSVSVLFTLCNILLSCHVDVTVLLLADRKSVV